MNDSNALEYPREVRRDPTAYPAPIVATSLISIIATFLLANSALELFVKVIGFSAIVGVFLAICTILFVRERKAGKWRLQQSLDRTDEIERGLDGLDEANEFFAGSLSLADTFRLVSSRVGDIWPYRSIQLFLLNESRTELRVTETEGKGTENEKGRTQNYDHGLAGQCYLKKRVEVDGYLMLDESQELGSSVAIPLCRDTEVFGVLQLSFDPDFEIDSVPNQVFEAIGTRVSPMVLSAISFERTRMNALTDVTTDLPNERAFYMVLEGKLAESIRKGKARPLTILAIDIRNYEEVIGQYGPAAGEAVLNFVGQTVKENLRQMDFIAHSLGDEFLVILPTATKEITHEIMARIHTGFFGRKLKVTASENIEVEINIGWATLDNDGDTTSQLLSAAHMRREQSKSTSISNVAWFPHETAH